MIIVTGSTGQLGHAIVKQLLARVPADLEALGLRVRRGDSTDLASFHRGLAWPLAALRKTEVDPGYGGYLNNDLAGYVVAPKADIGLLDRPDPLANSAGVKGLGRVTMVGISAAIANAVVPATGRRVRKIPTRIEDLL